MRMSPMVKINGQLKCWTQQNMSREGISASGKKNNSICRVQYKSFKQNIPDTTGNISANPIPSVYCKY